MSLPMQDPCIDAIDLKTLQDNASATKAERVGLSPSQCSRRRTALEKAGIIEGYKASLSFPALGFDVTAFVQIRFHSHAIENNDRLLRVLEAEPNVLEIYSTTGSWNIIAKVVVARLTDFDDLINRAFIGKNYIEQIQTMIVLKRLKLSNHLPIKAQPTGKD
ncbi:Lrp/AsnC family transcriptional regulator [Breoghania sp.]|uniref:Lrp/AsnC family transcriptional regulator n=1 Tax=Breoghania sp. TaxID=2065378 RepID=UPI002618686C|nr:Lrp/AsnC family transcriptional regulator [Breoghania sp.]MDJ0931693.1 Lrp/AsnC family transcriptional regulator [Breoghania sp.]